MPATMTGDNVRRRNENAAEEEEPGEAVYEDAGQQAR